MKVIVNGPEREAQKKCEVTCQYCKSILEISLSDPHRSSGTALIFQCAVCKKDIHTSRCQFKAPYVFPNIGFPYYPPGCRGPR